MEPELLLIDKPKGITSFDVIRRLRRQYSNNHDGAKAPKMGHAGTLDPLATGLMLIGVGKGTKALTKLTKLDKEYIAEIRFGVSTTTGDLAGEILETKTVTETLSELQDKLAISTKNLLGETTLPVSAYSAIKVAGVAMYKRAYKAAQTGDVVTEVPLRTMYVMKAEILSSWKEETFFVAKIRFTVASGTYIRSLAVELGEKLDYPATLQNLRRTKVDTYCIKAALQITDTFV